MAHLSDDQRRVVELRLAGLKGAEIAMVIDGEAAYLTFVREDGRWVIDVRDDSASQPLPIGTPTT